MGPLCTYSSCSQAESIKVTRDLTDPVRDILNLWETASVKERHGRDWQNQTSGNRNRKHKHMAGSLIAGRQWMFWRSTSAAVLSSVQSILSMSAPQHSLWWLKTDNIETKRPTDQHNPITGHFYVTSKYWTISKMSILIFITWFGQYSIYILNQKNHHSIKLHRVKLFKARCKIQLKCS